VVVVTLEVRIPERVSCEVRAEVVRKTLETHLTAMQGMGSMYIGDGWSASDPLTASTSKISVGTE